MPQAIERLLRIPFRLSGCLIVDDVRAEVERWLPAGYPDNNRERFDSPARAFRAYIVANIAWQKRSPSTVRPL